MNDDKPVIEVEDRNEDPAESEARRAEWKLRDRQRQLLLDLVERETLPTWAVVVMIRTGIIVVDEDPLPCEYFERNSHWTNWDSEIQRYRERLAQEAAEGKPQELPRTWQEAYERRPPLPNRSQCPLQALASEDERAPSPCVRVREEQRTLVPYREDPVRLRVLNDPADPVNEAQLHPCRALGLILTDSIWGTLTRRQHEAEKRRWPTGKPRA